MKTVFGMNGACGRMGQRIIQLAQEDKSLVLGAALEAPGHPQLGPDVGEVIGSGKLGVPVARDGPSADQRTLRIDSNVPAGPAAAPPASQTSPVPPWLGAAPRALALAAATA